MVVRIKQSEIIISYYEEKKKKKFDAFTNLSDFIMEQFSNWLNSYTKAFNKVYRRKGGLFIDYIKRSEVTKDGDLTSFIYYVHRNAVHHGLTKRIGDWKHDSYGMILDGRTSFLLSDFVIGWFGSRESFVSFHEQPVSLKNIQIDL